MRRSRLRAGLLVVVAMALTGIGYRVWRNVAERTPRSLGELGVELIPEVAQHMQNFHRIKVKNGHTEWDIKADDAQYYQKQNEIVVRAPEVTIYTEQGVQRAWLTGKEAHLGLVDDGREVGSMEIRGDVILWLDDLELRYRYGDVRSRPRPHHRAGSRHHHRPYDERERRRDGGRRHAAAHPSPRERAHPAEAQCRGLVARTCRWCWSSPRPRGLQGHRQPAAPPPTQRAGRQPLRLRRPRQEQGADQRHLRQPGVRLQGERRRL